MAESTTIRWEQDEDGIVVLTMDDPSQSANTMNAPMRPRWPPRSIASRTRRTTITGVVITSAKRTFFAGGDLNDLKAATKENAPELAEMVRGQGSAAAS